MLVLRLWLRLVLMVGSLSILLLLGEARTNAAAPAPQLKRYPYLQSTTSNSVIVVWTTTADLPSEVHFSVDNSFNQSAPATSVAQNTSSVYQHEASITGLSPTTTYQYQIISGGTDMLPGDPNLTFTTAPQADSRSLRFVVFGDSGTNLQSQKDVRDQMLRDQPFDFLVHVGDIAYTQGSYSQFEANYFAIYRALFEHVPVFPVAGNHEYITDNGAPYRAVHVLPEATVSITNAEQYYSFDWGDAHFTAFDSDPAGPITTKAFKDWLAADLAATTKTWKFVYMHYPAYSSGSHGPEPNVQALLPIFEQYHVDVVFNGHDHDYERTVPIRANAQTTTDAGGIVYITSGGGSAFQYGCSTKWWTAFKLCSKSYGGYTRVTLNNLQLTLEGVRDTGAVFDTYMITKNASTPPTAPSTPTTTPSDPSLPTAAPTDIVQPTAASTRSASPEPFPTTRYLVYLPFAIKDDPSEPSQGFVELYRWICAVAPVSEGGIR